MSTTITKLEASTRSTARFAKHLPDRILHSWRRRRLLQGLARLERLGSVLFVCHGNICRSPYAAFSFERRLPAAVRAHVRVHSAGFIGPDRPSPPEALIVSQRRGIDLSPHVSQLINANTVAGYDLVVVMDRKQAARLNAHQNIGMVIVLGDLDPRPIMRRTITDPFGQSEMVFEESYDRIDRCLDSLIAAVYPFDQ